MITMKNKIKIIKIWYPAIVALCIACVCCTGYDEYKKYMPNGEIIYPQKADSVKTYPGRNRVLLEWVLVDPKVTSCIVTYEMGGIVQGSITVPIQGRGDYVNDTIRCLIPDLEESTYMFKIVSYDDFGRASLTVEAEESTYGEIYERSLLNRMVKNVLADENGTPVLLEWYGAEYAEIGVDLHYTDVYGRNRSVFVDRSETSTPIDDINQGDLLSYRTMYKPVPSAIDTFIRHSLII